MFPSFRVSDFREKIIIDPMGVYPELALSMTTRVYSLPALSPTTNKVKRIPRLSPSNLVRMLTNQPTVDIEEDARFISKASNRSIVSPKNGVDPEEPENVITFTRELSSAITGDVSTFKDMYKDIYLKLGIPSNFGFDEACGEVEAIISAKFGTDITIDADIIEYVNSVLDTEVLASVLSKCTHIPEEVRSKVIHDYMAKQFEDKRVKLASARKSEIIRRYKEKYQNMVGEEERPTAGVVRSRRQ